ncbi:MAG TPA: chemotaxis protein CheW, partial [Gemmataceae bacterium]|nr:chemotaxis protein CheW [Gemmataceae bacterium]
MATQIQTARQLRVVRCRVGAEVYALDLRGVRGIHRSDGMRRERGPDGRTGYIPAQAGNVPVFALAEILGRHATALRASQHVVLMKSQGEPWGLLVDHVSQVVAVDASESRPLPAFLRWWPEVPGERVLLREQELLLLLRPDRLHATNIRAPGEFAEEGSETDDDLFQGSPPGNQMIVFTTSDAAPGARRLAFGLDLSMVSEIVDLPELTPVPRTPDFVRGLAVWRSRAVPVVDLACRLGGDP